MTTLDPKLDTCPWRVYVCLDYSPVSPDRVRRVSGWNAMVNAVRREIERCASQGDERARNKATGLLAWLDRHYRARDCSMKSKVFFVGRDAVCVQLEEPVGGAA